MRTLMMAVLMLTACCMSPQERMEKIEQGCSLFIETNFANALQVTHTCETNTDREGYAGCTVFVTWSAGTQPAAYNLLCPGTNVMSGCKLNVPRAPQEHHDN